MDTSAWIHAIRKNGKKEIQSSVKTFLEDGSACLCQPVLLELWNGARGQTEKRFLTELQNSLEILPSRQAAWDISYQIAKKTRVAGLTVPAIDILILSIAITSKADLIHDDSHFDSLFRLVK